jgi:tRNA threonylcarbamoyladenosine modification (KEOPS) complex  Pcc1 subunit
VSRHHAEIHHVKDHHYELIDKKSSNGLRINGVELQRGLIEAHDVIEFGDIILKFIPAGEVYRPTTEESQKIAHMLGVSDDVEILSHSARLKLAWSGMSRTARVSVSILGAMVFAMFVAVVVTGRLHAKQKAIQPAAISSVMRLVQAAQAKAAAEKFDEAHRLLAKVPTSSPVRREPSFRDVQSRWADSMLERATSATTNDEKRVIYEALIGEPSLDEAHRSRAQDNLNLLKERLAAAQALAPATAAPEAPAAAAAEPEASISSLPIAKVTTTNAKQATTTRTATKVSSGYSAASGAQNANSAGRAMAPIIAEKNRLKAKVASGDSTDSERRYLRALCRQLNDSSCSR